MTNGILEQTPYRHNGLISFYRVYQNQRMLVFHNISDSVIRMPVNTNGVEFMTDPSVMLSEKTLYLPAGASVVLKQ